MQNTSEALTGEYRHVRAKRTILVKQIVGPYVVLLDDNKKEVVLRKEDLFDNYNKVENTITTNHIQ